MDSAKTTVPITIIALVARKPSVSLDFFKDYYTNKHLPLFYRLVNGDELITSHTLHFIQRNKNGDPAVMAPLGEDDWKYDAVTRVVFKNAEAMQELRRRHGQHAKEISDDEKNFLDQATMKVVIMEESPSFEFR